MGAVRYFSDRISLLIIVSAVLAQPVFSAPAKNESALGEKKQVAKTELDASAPNTVVGNWVSEWGPVVFKDDGKGIISGSWEEGKNKIGKIEDGQFNPSTGELQFDFCETWTGLKGKAKLKLSTDHNEISGSWTRGKDKGTWKMHRPKGKAASAKTP